MTPETIKSPIFGTMLVYFMKSQSSLMRKTAADGITLFTSPSYCCAGCVSVLHRRDTKQIYI